ncbi:MAG: FAD-dependent oxidoreductase [Chloroflexota bacterium]|nr:FAD-dependent oxidoreductase [Chloroflexota bacterium]
MNPTRASARYTDAHPEATPKPGAVLPLTGAVGPHAIGDHARALGALDSQAQLDEVLTQGAKIHPQYNEAFETGVSIAWHQLPYSQGGWAIYTPEQREALYPRLFDFDARIHLAGDHMSYLNGWIEGAVLAAHAAATSIQNAGT